MVKAETSPETQEPPSGSGIVERERPDSHRFGPISGDSGTSPTLVPNREVPPRHPEHRPRGGQCSSATRRSVRAMADHAAIAGLLIDITGAALLARALAFETPERYVREAAQPVNLGSLAGIDPPRDFARAREGAEARVGATLLVLGFVGQAVGSWRSDWSGTSAIVAYCLAVVAITAGFAAIRPIARRREREIFLARLDLLVDPGRRYDLFGAYLAAFTQRDRPEEELRAWVEVAEERMGRHPWDELLPADAPRLGA